MTLSTDALIFGLGYLNGPKAKLSFGGEGAKMEITPRARAALNELLAAGYAEVTAPDDQIPGREHYRGTNVDPHLGELARAAKLNPFDPDYKWTTFARKGVDPEPDMLG